METLKLFPLLFILPLISVPALLLIVLAVAFIFVFFSLGFDLNFNILIISLCIAGCLPLSSWLCGAILDQSSFQKGSRTLSFFGMILSLVWLTSGGFMLELLGQAVNLLSQSDLLSISAFAVKMITAVVHTAAITALVFIFSFWFAEIPLSILNSGQRADVDFNFTAFRKIAYIFLLFLGISMLQNYFEHHLGF